MAQYYNSFGEGGLCKQSRLKQKRSGLDSSCRKGKIELTLHHTYFICNTVIFIKLVEIYTSDSEGAIVF